MKLLIVGHARHGKDTVSELLSLEFGLSFISSSEYCAENLIYPLLKTKYNYNSIKECFEDRSNHRAEWYEIIRDYNSQDPSRLGKEILQKYDIYCGLRNSWELMAIKAEKLVDLVIWVDASDRLPLEPVSSMTISKEQADVILDNNGTYEELVLTCKDFPWGLKVEPVI